MRLWNSLSYQAAKPVCGDILIMKDLRDQPGNETVNTN